MRKDTELQTNGDIKIEYEYIFFRIVKITQ